MQEMSKFQIFTVLFLLMFVFIVGAIYTSTKEQAENKMNEQYTNTEQSTERAIRNETRAINQDKIEVQSIAERVTNLEQQIQNTQVRDYDLKCKIRGVMDEGSFVNLTVEDAIEEAKVNNKEIVMTCSY